MLGLYKFYWDCNRMGFIDGLFIATADEVANLIGKRCHFGECLGKFSEIYGDIEEGDIELLSDDQDFVNKCISTNVSCGYNPFDYLPEEYEEE